VKIEAWQLRSTPSVADVTEVRRVGARASAARTADQTAAALFWAGPPLSPWMAAAAHAAQVAGLDPRQVKMRVAIGLAHARRVTLRIGDRIQYPTPQMLIRGDSPLRIVSMHVDPAWEPLLAGCSRSEAPSEACVVAGAVVATLRTVVRDDALSLEAVSPQACGVLRRFRSLSEMLQECEDAQVWAGLHLRSTVVESTELGLRLGEALEAKAKPARTI
jgi:hypothetical protein